MATTTLQAPGWTLTDDPDLEPKGLELFKPSAAARADAERPIDDLDAMPDEVRDALLAAVRRMKRAKEEAAIERAGKLLNARPELRAYLQVEDAFANLPEGTGLYVRNAEDPIGELEPLLQDLKQAASFVTLAIGGEILPSGTVASLKDRLQNRQAGQLAASLAKAAAKGLQVQALVSLPDEPSPVLVEKLNHPNGTLLGSDPGRDQIMAFASRVYSPELDPDAACRRSPIGAFLGRRLAVDQSHFVAEPAAGDRGGIGVLQGGLALHDPMLEEQRGTLASLGVNTCRRWTGVGEVVVDSNRSLLEGKDSRYIFASVARLRLLLQGIFYKTTEHEILHTGRRTAGPLEVAKGQIQSLLDWLKAQGWLEQGELSIDYKSIDLQMNVTLGPVAPIDKVTISFSEYVRAVGGLP